MPATVEQRKARVLIAKKESLYGILQTLVDLSKKLNEPASLNKFRTLYRSLETTRVDLIAVIDEIALLSIEIDENYKPDFAILRTIDELCYIHEAAAKGTRTETVSTEMSSAANRSLPTLPKIELPQFSGEIREWDTFYSIFKCLIHDNSSLTDADKVQYLVGRLRGPALTVCSGLSPTGDNYEIIWKSLLDKYQDKRAFANSYLDQIMEFKSIHGESSKNLNIFLEKFDAAVRALKKLEINDLTDFIFVHQALSTLDSETCKLFEMNTRDSEIPTYENVVNFIKEQAKILSRNRKTVMNKNMEGTGKSRMVKSFVLSSSSNRREASTSGNWKNACIYCNKMGHYIGRCEKFKKLSPGKRYEIVRDHNWCYNCLSSTHGVRSCTSERTCGKCGKRHHVLLHLGKPPGDKVSADILNSENMNANDDGASTSKNLGGTDAVTSLCSSVSNSPHGATVLLSTVVVNVENCKPGQSARFLLDSGSQANLITVECCKRLGITSKKCFSSLQGLGKNSHPVRGIAEVTISSRYTSGIQYTINCLLVDKIAEKLPRVEIDTSSFSHLTGIQLADNCYYKPREIDGILGAELYPTLIGPGRVLGRKGAPAALQTSLGYVVMGKVLESPRIVQTFFTLAEEPSVEQLVSKFWEIEDVPKRLIREPEELECEKIYAKTFSRDVTGRYTVALPFKCSTKILGVSKGHAHCRLIALEHKLLKSADLRLEYNKVMSDFIEQGHMEKVRSNDMVNSSINSAYYIPHHAVVKTESVTTPVRVVFDASAPSSSDVSLNDILFSGPKLQTDIFTVLINFRLFKFAVTADIRQMYRQINIIDSHRKFQRLLWRFHPRDEIDTYEITTVAFGVKASPYLALRTVKQLVNDEACNFPLASKIVGRDLYMDDLVSSMPSVEEAMLLYRESVDLFAAGKFDLTKWSTNCDSLLKEIPITKRFLKTVIFEADTKILGMQWNPEADILSFKITVPNTICTKRAILSAVAKCYDRIGLIAPFILYLKLIVKELWRLKLGWDEDPPERICRNWETVRGEWSLLSSLEVPRHIGAETIYPTMLLAFADASNDGYGSIVYLRTADPEGNISIKLICAKSKVSPFRMVTIPRLELCAALLLSKLVKHVAETYSSRIMISKIWAFSDSTTVIQSLNTSHLKDIFVSNRVAQIRENLPSAQWRHIQGVNNPADCVSRGLMPSQLIKYSSWLSGPSWLLKNEYDWPVSKVLVSDNSLEPEEVILVNTKEEDNHPLYDLILRSSAWTFILRTTVWVLRFLKLIPCATFITTNNLYTAELNLVKLVQLKHFKSDIQNLYSERLCSQKLRKLRPFLKDGLLRVGGRLGNASIHFEKRHPLLLPSKDPFVTLLVDYYHKINLHTGAHLLEALIRQKYWILGGRNLIRSRVYACNHCFRLRPKSISPLMADFPSCRVQQAKPFFKTGVDYFGPFNITTKRRKGTPVFKAYVCLFICMSIKAIHLELVSSLSTDHFLQAFKRFLARRGPCGMLYSDKGSNFIGAKRILSELHGFLQSREFNDKMQTDLALQGIEWRFNPPLSPHMGGIWESNVKAAKNHIYRVVGCQLLTYEEFATFLTQVEVLLNSRPLCRLSADPSDPAALTPAHFLTLAPLRNLPSEDVTEVNISRLDRFQLIDRMVQDYWKRWHLEYLTTLQSRNKWNKESSNVEVGTVVVLKNDNSPPLHWPLAIITAIHPGKDNIVRVVTVKTSKGTFARPVVKVCPLPTQ